MNKIKLKHKIGIAVLIVFIGIQFYRPNKNVQIKEATKEDLLVYRNAPEDIKELYTKACYDCHSNYTNYSWYNNIAPISWYVDKHVKEGVYVLNFSDWKNIPIIDKESHFAAIIFDINENTMPTKEYNLMHPEAILTDEEKAKMNAWIRQVKVKFIKEEYNIGD